MKDIRKLTLFAVTLLALSCGPQTSQPPDQPEPASTTFPTTPPDGPPPDIGPAPETYRPTAAGAPSTDIWIGVLRTESGSASVTGLRNLTDRDGYDNQPHFASNDLLYYVSVLDKTQSDVFRYFLSGSGPERVTHTEASEFSPNSIPGQNAFSTIYELRGKQYLWRFAADGTELGAIFATAEPVGYHAWADNRLVAMFILGDSDHPSTLQVGDALEGNLHTLAENPGRSIHRIPGTNQISFVRKVDGGEWWIEQLDPVTGASKRIIQTIPTREDYAWTSDGRIVMGEGSKLHIGTPGSGWTLIRDLAEDGITQISRLAVSPDGRHIAIVSSR